MTDWLVFLSIWFLGWMVTWPALLAWAQSKYDVNDFRDDLAIAMGLALLPPCWLLTPFITAFYRYGFQIRPRQ